VIAGAINLREVISAYQKCVAVTVGHFGASSPSTWATACLLDSKSPIQGPCAESEEKHEPASDADAAVVDSLKALDLSRPIREADITIALTNVRFWG
jgi:hypothetical protein